MSKLEKDYAVGKEVEVPDMRDGKSKAAVVIAHTVAGFKKFAGIIVRFRDGRTQECDREFL